ncbi:MAG: cbb3-type cytochrome c oxidase subunit I, partial [Candidatus Omnitrophica bacterium]|nr:cbb3-type cytochrome c oxidase subunit I [Candidatus Omnitrophota bacterium]
MRYWKLWLSFAFVIVASFGVLGYYGYEIYLQAPPIPKRVVDRDGNVLFTDKDIRDGQNVWQSMGGQEIGSVWGHGAYQAPDWSADWLHRELVAILDTWSNAEHGKPYGDLDGSIQAVLRERLKKEVRTNTYQSDTGDLTVSQVRAGAIAGTGDHYARLFGEDPDLQDLRESYAIPAGTLKDPERKRLLNAFFFWAAWACATNRPGQEITYTNNWPPERLIDNSPTGSIVLWSMISVVLLLAGIGALAWYQAVQRHKEDPPAVVPERDPLLSLELTPSMKATLKYFWVVAALFLVQVGLGVITAHYTVEGLGFYGLPLAEWFPYSVTRTWHIQLGIFWIATAWLATGLFVAPAVSGYEPRF